MQTPIQRAACIRDQLFATDAPVGDFEFDQNVAAVFDDMVARSVPFYDEVHRMVVELTTRFVEPGTTVCDIGCSTGSLVERMAVATGPLDLRFVAIEPSAAMRARAAERLARSVPEARVDLRDDRIEDLDELPGQPAVVTMLYTLQFVRPLRRGRVLTMVHDSLQPGGCLILAEKILADAPALRRLLIDLYHDYKCRHGYSHLEVAKKREALENVLVPFSDRENVDQLQLAGFSTVEPVFRWYRPRALLAVKAGRPSSEPEG